ncbi:mesoderm induction early response protein 1a isoform X1 [Tachysurus ichikawai]
MLQKADQSSSARGNVKSTLSVCKSGKDGKGFPLLCACLRKDDREDEVQRSSREESPDRSRTLSTAQLMHSGPCNYFDGDVDESEDEDHVPSEEWWKPSGYGVRLLIGR